MYADTTKLIEADNPVETADNAENSPPEPWQVTVRADLGSARMFSHPRPGGRHRIDLVPGHLTGYGLMYGVIYNNELLLKDSRTPALDAARALLDRGIAGKLEVYGGEPYPRLVLDIERAAGLTVQDDSQGRPVLRPYRPSADEAAKPTEIT